jgi:two-component system response regulator HydG
MNIRKTPTVLIVEDDLEHRKAMLRILQNEGYATMEADNGRDGLEQATSKKVDIIVTDLRLPVIDGVELLKRTKAILPDVEVILITGHGTVEVAVEAIKEGAYDFITKPIKRAQLQHVVQKAAEKQFLSRENKQLRSQLNQQASRRLIFGSGEMRRVSTMVEQVAPSTATILITGDSGTGKEVVADAIHEASPRRDYPMIKVSCAALPETLLEDELFGHEKGAFTGAHARKIGRFELANGGTLFLDEIGEVAPAVQVKLLRVLQDGKIERLGGTRTIDTDVRIIAATNKDLRNEVEEHRFREDLYYRLNVVRIDIPALKDRKEDVPMLAMHFLKLYSEKNRKYIEGFSEDAMLALNSYDWPGNVRELENAIEHAVVFTNGDRVPMSVLPHSVSSFAETQHSLTFKVGTPLRELEKQAIDITLQHTRGDKNMAARLLGIATRTIYRHLERRGQEEQETESGDTTSSEVYVEEDKDR